jgi:hypothetical protein
MKPADIMINEAYSMNKQLCHVYIADALYISIDMITRIRKFNLNYCDCCGWKLLGAP